MNTYDKMIEVINKLGFTSGTMMDKSGVCVLGALMVARNPKWTYPVGDKAGDKSFHINQIYESFRTDPIVKAMADEIRTDIDMPSAVVFGFSDRATKEEVIEFLQGMSEKTK